MEAPLNTPLLLGLLEYFLNDYFLLLLKVFFQSTLSALLRVVLPSVKILQYSFKILFMPLVAANNRPTIITPANAATMHIAVVPF